jgi:hypothetical protein
MRSFIIIIKEISEIVHHRLLLKRYSKFRVIRVAMFYISSAVF